MVSMRSPILGNGYELRISIVLSVLCSIQKRLFPFFFCAKTTGNNRSVWAGLLAFISNILSISDFSKSLVFRPARYWNKGIRHMIGEAKLPQCFTVDRRPKYSSDMPANRIRILASPFR